MLFAHLVIDEYDEVHQDISFSTVLLQTTKAAHPLFHKASLQYVFVIKNNKANFTIKTIKKSTGGKSVILWCESHFKYVS